jgi:hypothetical protein
LYNNAVIRFKKKVLAGNQPKKIRTNEQTTKKKISVSNKKKKKKAFLWLLTLPSPTIRKLPRVVVIWTSLVGELG